MKKYALIAALLSLTAAVSKGTVITTGLDVSGVGANGFTTWIAGDLAVVTSNTSLSTDLNGLHLTGTNMFSTMGMFINEGTFPGGQENISKLNIQSYNSTGSAFSGITLNAAWNSVSGFNTVIGMQADPSQAYRIYLDALKMSYIKDGLTVGRVYAASATRTNTVVVAVEEDAVGNPVTGVNALRITKKGEILIRPQGNLSMGSFTAGTTP